MQLFNRNLTGKTQHHYLVSTFVSAHKESIVERTYEHSELFDSGNLIQDRKKATAFYNEQLASYEGKFIYPLLSRNDTLQYKQAPHSTYSITLFLVQSFDGEDFLYPVMGESEEEMSEGIEIENAILNG